MVRLIRSRISPEAGESLKSQNPVGAFRDALIRLAIRFGQIVQTRRLALKMHGWERESSETQGTLIIKIRFWLSIFINKKREKE